MKFRIFLLTLTSALLFFSCKKDHVTDPIPNVSVNLSIPLNLPQYAVLNSIGNYIEIQGGYRGIILYRAPDKFISFDLACPYDPLADNAILEVDSSGVILIDYNCGSRFTLNDGAVLNGPATRSMRQYQTDYDPNSNTVYITN